MEYDADKNGWPELKVRLNEVNRGDWRQRQINQKKGQRQTGTLFAWTHYLDALVFASVSSFLSLLCGQKHTKCQRALSYRWGRPQAKFTSVPKRTHFLMTVLQCHQGGYPHLDPVLCFLVCSLTTHAGSHAFSSCSNRTSSSSSHALHVFPFSIISLPRTLPFFSYQDTDFFYSSGKAGNKGIKDAEKCPFATLSPKKYSPFVDSHNSLCQMVCVVTFQS